jgi:hypothetical protein
MARNNVTLNLKKIFTIRRTRKQGNPKDILNCTSLLHMQRQIISYRTSASTPMKTRTGIDHIRFIITMCTCQCVRVWVSKPGCTVIVSSEKREEDAKTQFLKLVNPHIASLTQ